MGCVNKSSKEFKDIAARHNLADNTLELITHKYWLETGNETLFPTDVYIQAQLGNTYYQESGQSVRELWHKMYSSPHEFHSLSELQAARKEASRFFPQSAIVHYRNAKGNYMLSVKRPVEQANYNKNEFFKELDNGGWETIDLTSDDDNRDHRTLDDVQKLFNKLNTDRTSQALADKVFKIAENLNLTIEFGKLERETIAGRYINRNYILYNKKVMENPIMII